MSRFAAEKMCHDVCRNNSLTRMRKECEDACSMVFERHVAPCRNERGTADSMRGIMYSAIFPMGN